MNWGELAMEIVKMGGKEVGRSFIDSTVIVYDAEKGEYYPADLLVFEESDGIIDAGTMFISINEEQDDEL
tara:strand:- start:331 stop:540 length:210 start_codon:yes stop_codon:yes gene_type:complete